MSKRKEITLWALVAALLIGAPFGVLALVLQFTELRGPQAVSVPMGAMLLLIMACKPILDKLDK